MAPGKLQGVEANNKGFSLGFTKLYQQIHHFPTQLGIKA